MTHGERIAEPCNEGVVMMWINSDWPNGAEPCVEAEICEECGGGGCEAESRRIQT